MTILWMGIIVGAIIGLILILEGLFAPTIDSSTRKAAMRWGGAIIVVLVLGPPTIKALKINKEGIELTRYEPTEQERDLAIEYSKDYLSPEIEKEGQILVQKAKDRPPKQRSTEDFLALATEKRRAKDYDAALENVFLGLVLKPEDIRVKTTLIYRKGTIYVDLGLLDQGKKYFQEARKAEGGGGGF